MLRNVLHVHFTESLKRHNIYTVFTDPKRTFLPNIKTVPCAKAEI